ncbi:MAG: C10 family peptidase [Bacteroidaceae bacterium]|nr:C10 family peptidase [Bacteroidaceae bacterium]MBQ9169676.1 C10 family peptidase [Bacteroidaceae bacterium]MBQ9294270.1 C10 family peptidase [Bacteroidaceae bacterium]
MARNVLLCILLVLVGLTDGRAENKGTYVFPGDVSPLIKTHWGQHHPFNLLCPKTGEDNAHKLAGCGPVAMAQMVNYHRYPSLSPDGSYTYDWDLMFPTFAVGLSKEEVVAVAKLISDCGVSSFTEYGTMGSSTSISLMMGALKRLFKYSTDMCIYERSQFMTPGRDSLFRHLLFEELKAGRPVIYRGVNEKEGGHLFIIDGCRKGKVHVNMGWAGNRDGYYDLDDLSSYSSEQWMLTEVADSSYRAERKEVTLSEPGTLSSLLSSHEQQTVRHLKLGGQMNASDFQTLRQMLRTGVLRTIDMEEVNIDALPDSAFYECTYLSHFVAPRTLLRTGLRSFFRCRNLNYAIFHEGLREVNGATFSGCTNLLAINLPGTIAVIDYNAFTSCESLLSVSIPEGIQRIGNYAFSYCNHLYRINLPASLREMGKEVFKNCDRLKHVINPER